MQESTFSLSFFSDSKIFCDGKKATQQFDLTEQLIVQSCRWALPWMKETVKEMITVLAAKYHRKKKILQEHDQEFHQHFLHHN